MAWLTVARFATNGLSVLTTIILARLLTPADFGLLAIAASLWAILFSVSEIAVAEALVQHKNVTDDIINTAWTMNLCKSLFLSTMFVALAYPASVYFSDSRLANIMLVFSIGAFVNGLQNPLMYLRTKELDFRPQIAVQIASRVSGFVVSVAAGLYFRDYWALVSGIMVGQFAITLTSYALVPYRPVLSLKGFQDLFAFSIWVMLGRIVNTANWNFDQLLVGKYLNTTQLGFYNVGGQIAQLPTREASASLTPVLFPTFATMAEDSARMRSAYKAAQGLLLLIILPTGAGLSALALPLVDIAMGPAWRPVGLIIQLLAPVLAFQALGNLAQALAMANGQTKQLFFRDLISFFYRVSAITLAISIWGFMGILIARVIVGVTTQLYNMGIVSRIIGASIWTQIRWNWRTFLSSLIMWIVLEKTLQILNAEGVSMGIAAVVLAIISGACLYFFVLFFIWYLVGKPSGSETEFLRLLTTSMKRL